MIPARRLHAFLSREHWLIGASLTRIMLGSWAVYFYLLHYPVRHWLWGPSGLWPFDRFRTSPFIFSLWQFSDSPLAFEAIYAAGVIVATLYTLGWHARLMNLLHALMIWSLQERNAFITDGGDNIMRIVLLFLMLVNTGAYFSLDAARKQRRALPALGPPLAVLHNVGVLLVLAQLCLLYASTGLYKVMGTVWQNGTALYYILRVDEFSWPGVAEFVYRNPTLVVLGTYGTVLFEVFFAPLQLNRWTRYAMLAAGVGFHAGIAAFMGLVTFSWSILSVYPMFATDGEYRMLSDRIVRALRLTVFYDGWCPFCTRSVRWLGRLDLFSLVRFVSFRDPGIVERYTLDPNRLERRIQSLGTSGTLSEGIDAVIQIALRSPLLWPAAVLFLVSRAALGQRAYDVFATRRLILVPGGCAAHCAPGAGRIPSD